MITRAPADINDYYLLVYSYASVFRYNSLLLSANLVTVIIHKIINNIFFVVNGTYKRKRHNNQVVQWMQKSVKDSEHNGWIHRLAEQEPCHCLGMFELSSDPLSEMKGVFRIDEQPPDECLDKTFFLYIHIKKVFLALVPS